MCSPVHAVLLGDNVDAQAGASETYWRLEPSVR
jgi:hypothetical protein